MKDHEMFSILLCKSCDWKCWTLDCYLDHARATHDVIFPGKETDFNPADEYFTWNLLSYDPSLEKSHHETCEKSKNDRKRVVQNGTKRLARFEDKYRPKWESIMKESITAISERKISNEDAVDVLTQMEKDFLAIKYRRVYTPRIWKNSNCY